MRSVKFAAILIVLPVFLGCVWAGYDYVRRYVTQDWRVRDRSVQVIQRDNPEDLRQRFLVGATAGALISVGYVVRCLFRSEDP